MKFFFIFLSFLIISLGLSGQSCTIFSKANTIVPDKLCSPVSVNWQVSYTGVDDAGMPVQIQYLWDDGTSVIVPAGTSGPGIFQATANHTYVSTGNKCNYAPKATLMVNGVLCTSSSQQQIVTVWDDDDHNGGKMHIKPAVYPICFGNGANVQFQDMTLFNCVPPQENDVPNLFTRWVQWIYGTDITMTGTPVTINGAPQVFPFSAPIITLTGPVTGSGVFSDIINVANDKLIGQHFQVTLRNWNYCNPYDDPNKPGPPLNLVDGDNPPVVTTAIILIVPYPDPTITPVDTLCLQSSPVTLVAHDAGGTWSGDGVTGNKFNPATAGTGDHIIRYNITDMNGCSASGQITINVRPAPVVTINQVASLFINDPPVVLVASPPGGNFTGDGMTLNTFNPASAGIGIHVITYHSIPDKYGCSGMDTIHIKVMATPPDATIIPVDTLCVQSDPVTLHAHDDGGIWSGDGVKVNKFFPAMAGVGNHIISYTITDTNGFSATDRTTITVMPLPLVKINRVPLLFLNDPPVVLIASPQGGRFTGNGLTGNTFYPDSAGVGIHILTYQTLTDRFGCEASDTIHIEVIMPPAPVADFIPDTTGCSPLLVHFRNRSKAVESLLWDFGDKTFSSELNPSHTYFIPGNYIVRLTVTNITGQSTHSVAISVYQDPTAQFSIYPTDVINNSQIVVFTNFSYFGVSWLWNFGDGTTSTEENPWHKYEFEGTYNVILDVTSREGCLDSMKYKTPVIVAFKTGEIKFPNAFKWNLSGPTGGYWNETQLNDNTFRPFFENVMDYKLQIFNRWGVLIYESHDVNKGWDGYFGNGNLAVQGVYVWKVTGQYADGSYFDKVGDVTFLH